MGCSEEEKKLSGRTEKLRMPDREERYGCKEVMKRRLEEKRWGKRERMH